VNVQEKAQLLMKKEGLPKTDRVAKTLPKVRD
jgi:hypothetical protein